MHNLLHEYSILFEAYNIYFGVVIGGIIGAFSKSPRQLIHNLIILTIIWIPLIILAMVGK